MAAVAVAAVVVATAVATEAVVVVVAEGLVADQHPALKTLTTL